MVEIVKAVIICFDIFPHKLLESFYNLSLNHLLDFLNPLSFHESAKAKTRRQHEQKLPQNDSYDSRCLQTKSYCRNTIELQKRSYSKQCRH